MINERTSYAKTFSLMADKNISHTQRRKKLGRPSYYCTLIISYVETLLVNLRKSMREC